MANLLNLRKFVPVLRQSSDPFLRMQTALDSAMGDFYEAFDLPSAAKKVFENLAITPAIDIVDDKDHFKVEVEMPGMGEEDVQVEINDNMLTIKGEKQTSERDKDKNYLMREIHYGSYERRIQLPDSVDLNKAKATFKKGMLWVEIPKRSEVSKENRTLKVEKA